jgi:tetratricopeptide (TPR) repeat protein
VIAYRQVLEGLPLPQYAAELGDLLAALGRAEEARAPYAMADTQLRLIGANGGRTDLQAALFAADHGDPGVALDLAQREHAVRQSIHTDDALAWALHRNGRNIEALVLAQRAVRLGTRDASLHFHLGMIEAALDRGPAARTSLQTALEINPYFSLLHAPTARAQLLRLDG